MFSHGNNLTHFQPDNSREGGPLEDTLLTDGQIALAVSMPFMYALGLAGLLCCVALACKCIFRNAETDKNTSGENLDVEAENGNKESDPLLQYKH